MEKTSRYCAWRTISIVMAMLWCVLGCPTLTPPEIKSILKPFHGENTGSTLRPTYTWTSVDGADSYELQVDDDPGFGSIDYSWGDIAGTSYRPGVDMAVETTAPVSKRYFTRSRALDADSTLVSAWSDTVLLHYVNVGRFDCDYNGDGYSDAIVGAPYYNSKQGRAYIYYGGASMDNDADVIMTGEATSDHFGASVASARDVNNIGCADAMVAPYKSGAPI